MKKLFLSLILFSISLLNAQNNPKEVLFSVDDNKYYSDDFVRIYNKNLDLVKDESQKDLDKYLDLYIGYKLKVNKANKLGLQNSAQYKNELKSYRNQLAKSYLTDSKVTAELVDEAYKRLQKEINASHILIMCDEAALPADTLKAYNKALNAKKRIDAGEDFETVALATSEDPSVKENKGALGWFTVFRMVYPFENAAYNTAIGKVSKPARSRFGYHLVKVNDVRPNRGEITVAHIMIMSAKEGEDQDKPKNTINEVYKKLQQGEKFEDLARQFSEDKSSAQKGGVLNKFSSGQLSSQEFEDVAFNLTNENPVSQPFKSSYGWHIVKLIEKFPVKTIEESKIELENKISKDDRSRLISNSLTEKLRKKYTIKTNKPMYDKVKTMVFDNIYEGKWELPTNTKPYDENLLTIDKKAVTGTSFLEFIKNNQKTKASIKPLTAMVDALYPVFVDDQLNMYYNDNLENEFPEFLSVMDEYRDGLLLFDLMEKEIWQRSKKDTLGLEEYYKNLKEKPQWKTRAQAIILSSTNQEMTKKAFAMLKKGKTVQEIKDKLNTKETVNIMANEAFYEQDDQALPTNTKMQVGFYNVDKKGDYYYASQIIKVLPAGDKTIEESKGKLINDYQQYLEQNWINELKKEFTVKVNQAAFNKVKTTIKK